MDVVTRDLCQDNPTCLNSIVAILAGLVLAWVVWEVDWIHAAGGITGDHTGRDSLRRSTRPTPKRSLHATGTRTRSAPRDGDLCKSADNNLPSPRTILALTRPDSDDMVSDIDREYHYG